MKVFNDPVHGHFELPAVCVSFIDTRQFQRLRALKQLGASYHVFPGATHNRFEHSLGTCHLAITLLKHLRSTHPQLLISDRDCRCVQLAALCHDLGHGPFSHLFDAQFMPMARKNSSFSHENASQQMVAALVAENNIDIPARDLEFIQDLINGAPRPNTRRIEKPFLFDIVCNKRNSVDVDKLDYIQRDCHNIGIKSSVDAVRLITFTRVVDNQICFNQKEAFNLYELFHTRYSLFKRVYTHRVSTAIEYMIRDILLIADPVLKISDSVNDMDRYVLLDDSILSEIAKSTVKSLEPARKLMNRLQRRDLYRCVDQVIIPLDLMTDIKRGMITESEIVRHSKNIKLSEKDIIVEWLQLNYAFKDQNPVDSIRFFSKQNLDQVCKIPKEVVSGFIPQHYKEVTVRIYTRNKDLSVDIQLAFRLLLNEINAGISAEQPLQAQSLEFQDSPVSLDIEHNVFLSTSQPSSRNPSPLKSRLLTNDSLTLSPMKRAVQASLESEFLESRKKRTL